MKAAICSASLQLLLKIICLDMTAQTQKTKANRQQHCIGGNEDHRSRFVTELGISSAIARTPLLTDERVQAIQVWSPCHEIFISEASPSVIVSGRRVIKIFF
jgi:hypothetical protein